MRNHGRLCLRACPVATLVALAFATPGCATTVHDFRLDHVRADEGAIVGKLDIIYNGEHYNTKCSVLFGDTAYKLDDSGLVLLVVKRGPTKLARVACQDHSIYHYDFDGAQFVTDGGGVVTYFGNVTLDWQTDGGFKVSSFFGVIGAVADASSNDGHAKLSVADVPDAVREVFVKQVGRNPPWTTHLLSTGR